MNEDFFIIHKSILPDYFELVLKTKGLVDDDKMSVSDACRMTGISRSTFYKYKDNIFLPSTTYGKKAIVALKTLDKMGVLSNIISLISRFGANVITINQDMPIKDTAYITIAIDVTDLRSDITELIKELRNIEHVRSANVVALD